MRRCRAYPQRLRSSGWHMHWSGLRSSVWLACKHTLRSVFAPFSWCFQIYQISIHSCFLRQRFFLLFAPGDLNKTIGTLLASCSGGMNRDVLSCKEFRLEQFDGKTIMICVICGGTGGARLARGISYLYHPAAPTYISNVRNNIQVLGLRIFPDNHAIIYSLPRSADFYRGWALPDESL